MSSGHPNDRSRHILASNAFSIRDSMHRAVEPDGHVSYSGIGEIERAAADDIRA